MTTDIEPYPPEDYTAANQQLERIESKLDELLAFKQELYDGIEEFKNQFADGGILSLMSMFGK